MADPQGTHRHDTVLLDVDGTLVDSTYHHALAWHRAFQGHGIRVPMWKVHRAIGMGGDRLVAAVAGDDVEESLGDTLREEWEEGYERLIDEVEPLPGAADLVRALVEKGFIVGLASSGKPDHTRTAVERLGVGDLLAAVTTSEDAESSKPAPDILSVALEKCGGTSAIVVGDSTFDIASAARIGSPCGATRTGGFGRDELREAGAVLVADGMVELLEADWAALSGATPPGGAENDPQLP